MVDEEQQTTPSYLKMDWSIENAEDRVLRAEEILAQAPAELLERQEYISKLADYIVQPIDKEERKKKKILTENRMVTVNKRETSFEGLVGKLENGEDGIYNMITNDKNIIFQPKISITDADVAEMPELKELRESIKKIEEQLKTARGRKAFLLKKQLIEMRQDQYVIKSAYKKPIHCLNLIRSFSKIDLDEDIFINEKGEVDSTGLISLTKKSHVSAILCNYAKLKEDSWSNFVGDAKWLLMDLENLIDKCIKDDYPIYYDILIYKIDGLQNADIQSLLVEKHDVHYSVEYISSLWRNKIPKLIAEQAVNDWLVWHYTFEEKGKWKKCNKCGQIKLAHNNFFSKNKSSKDGWYSICKECRNKKYKEKKEVK